MSEASKPRLLRRKCDTCIFRPGNLMKLRPGRVESMEKESMANDATITCHETLDKERAVCRGFYDRNHRSNENLCLRIGDYFTGWELVDPQ